MVYLHAKLRSAVALLLLTLLAVLSINAQTNGNSNKGRTEPPRKKAGVKRIGVILPKVSLNNVGKKTDPAIAVRNLFFALLNSDEIELIPINARLNVLAEKEALAKDCDYVLRVTLLQKQNSKGGGILNRVLDKTADSAISESTSQIPTGNTVGGNVGRQAAQGAGKEITHVEFTIKKKDRLILNYDMSVPGKDYVLKKSHKITAKRDNDDVLGSIIEKAANEIASFLLR